MSTSVRPHKVVLETVTQEKKKLRSQISFHAVPPQGYTFIPAGNPQLTTALKEASRVDHPAPESTKSFSSMLTAAGTILGEEQERDFHHQQSTPGNRKAFNSKSQIDINTEAREAIKDLFPNIPDDDLFSIIKNAFQKGSHKVGTAIELGLSRRAQLAVVAHIRHRYTNYDKMLRKMPYLLARSRVEKDTLRWLVQWRGDDENGSRALEDVFREVVVISDDENSDEDSEYGEQFIELRDVSVEVVSSATKAPRLTPDAIGFDLWTPGRRGRYPPHEDRRKSGGKKRPPKKKRGNGEERNNRRGLNRNQAWTNALKEFRENPATPLLSKDEPEPFASQQGPLYSGADTSVNRALNESRIQNPFSAFSKQWPDEQPKIMRAPDPPLYERVADLDHFGTRSNPIELSPPGLAQVRPFPVALDPFPRSPRQHLRHDGDGLALSIESPRGNLLSTPRRQVGIHPSHSLREQSEFEKDPFNDYYANRSKNVHGTGKEPHEPPRQGGERAYISLISPPAEKRGPRDYRAVESPFPSFGSRDAVIAKPTRFDPPRDSFRTSSANGLYADSRTSRAPAPTGFAANPAMSAEDRRLRRSGESLFPQALQPTMTGNVSSLDTGIQTYWPFRAGERAGANTREWSPVRAIAMTQSEKRPVVLPPARYAEMMELDGARTHGQNSEYRFESPSVRGRAAVPSERLVRQPDYGLTRDRDYNPVPRRRSASPTTRLSRSNAYSSAPMHDHRQPEPLGRYAILEDVGNRPVARSRRRDSVLMEAPRRAENKHAFLPASRVGGNSNLSVGRGSGNGYRDF